MAIKKKDGGLTKEEKPIVKALLKKNWRNQDIQALINIGRKATINSARITGVKQDDTIKPSSNEKVDFFIRKKNAFDPRTGLNLYDDERLVRAREAMILAVHVFNNPALWFKTELFAVLANIAWTYLLHEFYARKKISIEKDGQTLALGAMIERPDCPLSKGIKNNLKALKSIRDTVEHRLLKRSDSKWLSLFQACCLNFDKCLRELFGEKTTLQNELSLALQFSKLDLEQIETLSQFDIPKHIEALSSDLDKNLSNEELSDIEYQFKVYYTLSSSSKGQSHIQFLSPDSVEGKEIHNILVKHKPADVLYPYKPKAVVSKIVQETGKKFTSNNHVQAWKLLKARPDSKSKNPDNTNLQYCIYHQAHKDYTYSDKWIGLLIEKVSNDQEYEKIRNYGKKKKKN